MPSAADECVGLAAMVLDEHTQFRPSMYNAVVKTNTKALQRNQFISTKLIKFEACNLHLKIIPPMIFQFNMNFQNWHV